MNFPPNDPFAQPMLGPGTAPLDDGMTLHQLENILSDIRFQPKWRDEANKAVDYFDGNQLDQERLARMDRLGIPPLVTNLSESISTPSTSRVASQCTMRW